MNSSEITHALGLPYCSFIANGLAVLPVGNSYVLSVAYVSLIEAAKSAFPDVLLDQMKMGQNLVRINGPLPDDEQPAEEYLHTHISGIVAAVTQGAGLCLYERDGTILRQSVRVGDLAVIPPGAPHTFEGTPALEYMVIEFGPELDYQKHHYARPKR